jgi:hypothetical protein
LTHLWTFKDEIGASKQKRCRDAKTKFSITPFLRCGQSRTWKRKPPNESKELEYKIFGDIDFKLAHLNCF